MDDSAIRETVVIVAGPRWPRTEAVQEIRHTLSVDHT